MGDSSKVDELKYTFDDHFKYLSAWIENMGFEGKVCSLKYLSFILLIKKYNKNTSWSFWFQMFWSARASYPHGLKKSV